MPPTLHPLQHQALEALDWLHSQRDVDRRTGRSTVQAIHYLRRLVRGDTDRNGRVLIDDHADVRVADENLLHAIMNIADEFGIRVRPVGPRAIELLDPVNRGAADALIDLVPQDRRQARLNMAHAHLRPPPSGQPNPCAEIPLSAHGVVEPKPEPVRRSAWEHMTDSTL